MVAMNVARSTLLVAWIFLRLAWVEGASLERKTSELPFNCKVCKKGFHRRHLLLLHKMDHEKKPLEGDAGGAGLDVKAKPRSELTGSPERSPPRSPSPGPPPHYSPPRSPPNFQKPFLCDVCGNAFKDFQAHKRTHAPENRFTCTVCEKRFGSEDNLKLHMRTHTGGSKVNPRIHHTPVANSGPLRGNAPTGLALVGNSDRPFLCDVCGNAFKRSDALQTHTRTHSDVKQQFKCGQCRKSFSTQGNLKVHMGTHTGEKPFLCTVCGKVFLTNGNLKAHMGTHTGKEKRKCDVCGETFPNSNFKRHMDSHTGVRRFQCNLCGTAFLQKGHLEGHMVVHTGERRFPCEVCRKEFQTNSNLKTHMRVHTGEKPFKCPVCQLEFSVNSTLKRHIRVKHRAAVDGLDANAQGRRAALS